MNNISLRKVLILLAAVIVALLALGFVSTLLNQVIPITLALIVGVVVGRMTVNVNLMTVLKDALRRAPVQQPETKAEKPQAQPAQAAADESLRAEVDAIKRRITDVEPEAAKEGTAEEFEIKSEEQILAEARRLEDEVARRAASYDPSEALAERRRRLLGEQADKSDLS